MFCTRSETRSNELVPIQVVHLVPETDSYEASHVAASAATASASTIQPSPRRKIGLKKKLTPKKLLVVPASLAANTRSKKKLQVE